MHKQVTVIIPIVFLFAQIDLKAENRKKKTAKIQTIKATAFNETQ